MVVHLSILCPLLPFPTVSILSNSLVEPYKNVVSIKGQISCPSMDNFSVLFLYVCPWTDKFAEMYMSIEGLNSDICLKTT